MKRFMKIKGRNYRKSYVKKLIAALPKEMNVDMYHLPLDLIEKVHDENHLLEDALMYAFCVHLKEKYNDPEGTFWMVAEMDDAFEKLEYNEEWDRVHHSHNFCELFKSFEEIKWLFHE